MQENKTQNNKAESNVIERISFRYLPYWPLFVLMLVVAIAGGWGYLQYATPLYQATATIMVKDEKKGVDDSKLMDALNIYTSTKIVENEIEVLRSRAVMNEVVNELYLYAPIQEEGNISSFSAYQSSPIVIAAKDPNHLTPILEIYFTVNRNKEVVINRHAYPLNTWVKTPYGELQFKPNEKKSKEPTQPLSFSLFRAKDIADIYLTKLEVSAASKLSTVINVAIKDEVPQRAEDILNDVLDIYNRFSVREKNKLAASTLSFVKDRLQYVEAELDSMERALQQFKSEKKVTDLSEQGKLYLQSVGENDQKSAEISIQLAVLDQVEKYIVSKDNKMGIIPSTLGVSDPALAQMLEKLRDDELKYEVLRKTTAENNPLAVSLANEIENIRPGIMENIRNQRKALIASQGQLENTTGMYNSRLQTIPQKERELLDISRQQIIKSDVYTFLLHKREETALSYASTVADSWIVSTAQSSTLPVSPNKIIIYMMAVVLGFIVAAAVVTVKEIMNKKVLFRSEIEEATKLPIASEILYIKGKKDFGVTQEKGSPLAEQFRQLRAAIGMYGKNTSIKKLLVTSSIAGEGKSFVSSNLALSLSFSGKKVLLLDLDLRSPAISSITGIGETAGIKEFLEDQITPQEIIHNVIHKNLFVITAGSEAVNPTELLLSGKLGELFDFLENRYDYIVMDTSPITPVTDAYVLSEYADTTLFVIRHGSTPKKMMQSLDDNSKIKALKNVSIVFNGIRSRGLLKGKYGFGYGYGYEYVYKEKFKKGQRKQVLV